MVREAVLTRMNNKISSYIERYATLVGADKKEEVLKLFDNIQVLFPNWIIMTCPVMHPKITYLSSNASSTFGYDMTEMSSIIHMNRYFNYIHEADQQYVHDCIVNMHDFLESVPADEHHRYRAIFNYRFRKPNGQFIHVHDEKAVLNLKGSGNLYYCLLRDISSEKPFTGVKVEIYESGTTYEKIKEFKPAADKNPLSKRENELVTLIKQGLSTKEIAWYLNISHHTVRNIKSKLFEKFNVNNTIELLNMTA